MEHFIDLITNRFLWVALSSWLWAQLAKVIIHSIVNKKLDITRMFGDGGMPSGHSATVCSFATYAAFVYGTGSFQFAASTILALIVCRDAMGVRREAGKQAMVLNELLKSLKERKNNSVILKEFVGHTPTQVAIGALLGIINACAFALLVK